MEFPFDRRSQSRGFTLLEVMVAVGIALLLLAFSAPFIINYRGKNSVNRAVELVKAGLEKTAEVAKTSGVPLQRSLRLSGLVAPTSGQAPEGTTLWLRQRKRPRPGDPIELLTQIQLSNSDSIKLETTEIGYLDLDSQTEQEGLFVELVARSESATTVLVVIPVDVNGEFVLLGPAGKGSLALSYGDYRREVTLRVQGTVTLDRR